MADEQHSLTRMDTHVHSRASDGPAVAALGFIHCPESYSEPEAVYDQARARGMDLVTLTDHDTIKGALELDQRGFQGFIIGEEVTTYFPEDRCKLHVVVWSLTGDLHEQIETRRLRDDVYALAHWLRDHNLPHSLAHPLYVQNGRLNEWHLERCALLFKGFETLNGAHDVLHRPAIERFLATLSPRRILDLAHRHGFDPIWERSWEKATTGGSDDHALLNAGRTWTAIPGTIADPREFFRLVMRGEGEPGGVGGHAALLAHQLASVGAHYAGRRLGSQGRPRARHVRARLFRFAGVQTPRPSRLSLALDTLKRKTIERRKRTHPLLAALREALPAALERHPVLRERLASDWTDGAPMAEHEEMETLVSELAGAIGDTLQSGALRAVRSRDARALMDHIASYAILELAQLPYIVSLFHQQKERWLVERMEHDLAGPKSRTVYDRPMRVTLFTDTLGDVNGVTRFIRTMAEHAHRAERDFNVITSTRFPCPDLPNIHNLAPRFSTTMPRYQQLELALPPIVDMLRLARAQQPDVIHISTPGPVGLVGLLAARMMKTPVVGVYHTDFPAFVEDLFSDHMMTRSAAAYMRFFYKRFARVLTRSASYIAPLLELGLSQSRLERLPAGIDTDAFNTSHQDLSIWDRLGVPSDHAKVLYCGRVSVEKNLPLLTQAWPIAAAKLQAMGVPATFVVVGDGPYRQQMERELKRTPTKFLGFKHGQELSTIYASSDMLVFPSLTDTLGQVVMESLSSGMPAIVSNVGGPAEIVEHERTGLVVPSDAAKWADAIVRLASRPQERAAMGARGAETISTRTFDHSFEAFWRVHETVRREHLNRHGIREKTERLAEPADGVASA
ncbi:MAG: glycosyltransferase [Phycisphaeraceae bacterium]|nr:glycosyltransferase [Phycisphaeraceae bacterium]